MPFITSADCQSDKLLQNIITATDLEDTQNFLLNFALSLGVAEADIVSPTPYFFKQLGVAYTYMMKCRNHSGKTFHDQSQGITFDPYFEKYSIYQKEVASLKSQINQSMLSRDPDDLHPRDWSMTMQIFRG